MSKIFEALKQAEQERSDSQRDTVRQLAQRVAADREVLSAAIAECQDQLGRLLSEPRGAVEEALRRFESESRRQGAVVEAQAQQLAGMLARLDLMQLSSGPVVAGIQREVEQLLSEGEEQRRHLAQAAADIVERANGTIQRIEALGKDNRDEVERLLHSQQELYKQIEALGTDLEARTAHTQRQLDKFESLWRLPSKVDALSAEFQRTNHRVLRIAEQASSEAGKLEASLGELREQHDNIRAALDADVDAVRRQLVEALRDLDHRVTGLAGDAQKATADQQQTSAELRQELTRLAAAHSKTECELRTLAESSGKHASDASSRIDILARGLQGHDDQLGNLTLARQELASLVQDCAARLTDQTSIIQRQGRNWNELQASIEALDVRWAESEASHAAAVQTLHDNFAKLDAALSQSSSIAESNTERIERLGSALDKLGERLQAAEDAANRSQWDQALAEQRQALASLTAETRCAAAVQGEMQAAQSDLHARLTSSEQARADTERRVADLLSTVQSAQRDSAEAIEALQIQIATLVQGQNAPRDLADAVANAQATADAVVHQLAELRHAQESSHVVGGEQVAALQADGERLRDVIGAQANQVMQALRSQRADMEEAIQAQVTPLRTRLQETSTRLETRLDEALGRLGKAMGYLSAMTDEGKTRDEEIRSALSTSNTERRAVMADMRRQADEIERVAGLLDGLASQSAVIELQERLADLSRRIDASVRSEDGREIGSDATSLEQEIVQLKQQVDERLDVLTHSVDELREFLEERRETRRAGTVQAPGGTAPPRSGRPSPVATGEKRRLW